MVRSRFGKWSKSGMAVLAASGLVAFLPAAAQDGVSYSDYVCETVTRGDFTFRYEFRHYYSGAITLYTWSGGDSADEVGQMTQIASDWERGELYELDDRFWVYVGMGKAIVSKTDDSYFCEGA